MKNYLDIIVPVYNGERFIADCLDSLFKAFRQGVSVIVVNDGSSDSSRQIIRDRYSEKMAEGKLVLIDQENRGVSAARNRGIQSATAEYVGFVDCDDLVDPTYIETILSALKAKPDVVELSCRIIDESSNLVMEEVHPHELDGVNDSAKVLPLACESGIWYPFLRVVKRSLFESHPFPEGVRFCEDMMALYDVYRKAEKIYTTRSVVYGYRINSLGATKNIRPDYFENLLHFYRSLPRENDRALLALKLNLAYVMRRCTAGLGERFGRLPRDIEKDMLLAAFKPRSYMRKRVRLAAMAIWGGRLNWLKMKTR